MSSSYYCIKCGAKLKTGAKFCTKCGTKQKLLTNSSQKDKLITNSNSTSVNTYSRSKRQTTATSTVQISDNKSTQDFSLDTIISLEIEIQDLTLNMTQTEKHYQALDIYTKKKNQLDQITLQVNNSLIDQTKIKTLLQQLSWNQFKEYKKRYGLPDNFQELQIFLYLVTKKVFENNSVSLNNLLPMGNQDTELKEIKSTLKQKQDALENNHYKFLRGITNYKQYSKTLTNLSYFQSKSIEIQTNLFFIEKIQDILDFIIEDLQAIKFECEFSVSGVFSYNQVLTSLDNDTFQKIFQKAAEIEIYRIIIESLGSQIKFPKSISVPKFSEMIINQSIILDFLNTDSFSNTNSLIERIIHLYKQLSENIDSIYDSLNSSKDAIDSNISTIKDNILKMRQEFLIEGKIRSTLQISPTLPELEKQSLNIETGFDNITQSEFLKSIDNLNFSYTNNSLLSLINIQQKPSKDALDTTSIMNELADSGFDPSAFKISMPKLPKLTSMNSMFLQNDNTNKIKIELGKISYLFKKLLFDSDFKAECTFYTGSVKSISFDYPENQDFMNVSAQLSLSIEKDIYFLLFQQSNRKSYTWEDPFAGIQVDEADDDTRKKLFRERRIAEKFNAIPGQVSAKITTDEIRLILENNEKVIQPTIEFLKEISFIINLSFRF